MATGRNRAAEGSRPPTFPCSLYSSLNAASLGWPNGHAPEACALQSEAHGHARAAPPLPLPRLPILLSAMHSLARPGHARVHTTRSSRGASGTQAPRDPAPCVPSVFTHYFPQSLGSSHAQAHWAQESGLDSGSAWIDGPLVVGPALLPLRSRAAVASPPSPRSTAGASPRAHALMNGDTRALRARE